VLVSSGGVATGVVLGILMAIAIGGIEASTADLDSTATDTTPSDVPTAVDGGIDSTELASWARESRSTGTCTATAGTSVIDLGVGAKNGTRFPWAERPLNAATVKHVRQH
jgi:hypothetical protein